MTGRTSAMHQAMADSLNTGRAVLHVSRDDEGRVVVERVDPADVYRALEHGFAEAARQCAAAAQVLVAAFAGAQRALAANHAALVRAGVVPDTPPADPMARALHARRHRNTGPQVHADPRRNRRRR